MFSGISLSVSRSIDRDQLLILDSVASCAGQFCAWRRLVTKLSSGISVENVTWVVSAQLYELMKG